MMYVRGHPGDFDSWAADGATGWSYAEVLPYFRTSEDLTPNDEIIVDAPAHNTAGPLGVSVSDPILPAARQFVEAAVAAGIPRGDYNGRDRGGPAGLVSLSPTTTWRGRRSSTYQAFLAGEPEQRPNLTIITGAQATRVILTGPPQATEQRHGHRVPHPFRRDCDRSRRQGSHLERRRGRLAAIAGAVRGRAAAGAGHRRRPLSRRLAACRQAFERSLADPSVLSGTRGRRADERSRAVDGTRRIARPRRAAARRSRRPREGFARSPGVEAGSGTAVHRVADDRTRAGLVIACRCRGLLFDRPRRPAQPRHGDHALCYWRQ
jgi:hypothetical protein